MAIFSSKPRKKRTNGRFSVHIMALILFVILFISLVFAIDGTPAGAFISALVMLIFFSTILADWRERRSPKK